MASVSANSRLKRDRVLVEVSEAPILLRALAGIHRRGARLRDLALLGLAAERLGFGYAVEGDVLRLTGMGAQPMPTGPLRLDVSNVEQPLPDVEAVAEVTSLFF